MSRSRTVFGCLSHTTNVNQRTWWDMTDLCTPDIPSLKADPIITRVLCVCPADIWCVQVRWRRYVEVWALCAPRSVSAARGRTAHGAMTVCVPLHPPHVTSQSIRRCVQRHQSFHLITASHFIQTQHTESQTHQNLQLTTLVEINCSSHRVRCEIFLTLHTVSPLSPLSTYFHI